jgi:hypothetical protein
MPSRDLGQAFLNGDSIAGVVYAHNDCVRVVSGPHTGDSGSLVTVLSVDPEPKYILEAESGRDIEVLQSQIERVSDRADG